MIVIGLVAREQRGTVKGDSVKFLGDALARLRGRWPVLVVLALLGAAVGAGVASRAPIQHATRVSILLATSPVFLTLTEDGSQSRRNEVTIDTEAALLVARESLSRVVDSTDPSELSELRSRVRVTAVPSTRVLTIEVRARSAARSESEARALARSYLETRRGYLYEPPGSDVVIAAQADHQAPSWCHEPGAGASSGPTASGAFGHDDHAHAHFGWRGAPVTRAGCDAQTVGGPGH